MNVLDLFSGIGGFSLGLERAGMRTVAFCEIEPYCRAVLRKHWPNVPCYDDVRSLTAERLQADGIAVDLICGGFPCQDVSAVGTREGIGGARSGLWAEYARLIRELRPRYVVVENVTGLLDRGLGRVLRDLAALGFDAEWTVLSACMLGWPHSRERVFLLAYPHIERQKASGPERDAGSPELAKRCEYFQYLYQAAVAVSRSRGPEASNEPRVGRVAHGVPCRVERNAAIGNAIFSPIPEIIGRAILEAERNLTNV